MFLCDAILYLVLGSRGDNENKRQSHFIVFHNNDISFGVDLGRNSVRVLDNLIVINLNCLICNYNIQISSFRAAGFYRLLQCKNLPIILEHFCLRMRLKYNIYDTHINLECDILL